MKKNYFVFAAAVMSMFFASCSSPAKLTNTATHVRGNAVMPVSAVLADLEVSPTKITFFYIPSATVVNGGEENVVNSAVREALMENNNADVLVALEKQLKYNAEGKIESITITGFPAKYVNFRSPSDEFLMELSKNRGNDTKGNTSSKLPFGL